MIDSLTDMSMEGTFTIEEADLKKLQEVLCDIKVEECPWFEVHDKYGKSAKYYRDGLSRWIPCKDRMPEKGQKCLVWDKGTIAIDTFIGNGKPYDWKWYMRDYEAWMPLPEPYKGE